MRIVTFVSDKDPGVGIISDDRVLDLRSAYRDLLGRDGPASMLDLIEGGEPVLDEIAMLLKKLQADGKDAHLFHDLSRVRLLSPIPAPRKNVFCVGRNYKLHIEEGARSRGVAPSYPSVPEFFTKPATSVIGHNDEILLDTSITSKLDYEVELAFVIGRRSRNVPASRAQDVIFGFTILNDVTARDLQIAHGQWFKGKSLDTYCPIGPMIVTVDEFGSCAGHALRLRVNGEVRQSSTTDDMLFDCATIIESLSAGMTLEPGDIVTTGTPSGVGLGMSPQVWLKDGDVLEAEVEGVGICGTSFARLR